MIEYDFVCHLVPGVQSGTVVTLDLTLVRVRRYSPVRGERHGVTRCVTRGDTGAEVSPVLHHHPHLILLICGQTWCAS